MKITDCQDRKTEKEIYKDELGLDIFIDKNQLGKERPWRKHKMESEVIAKIYESIGNIEKSNRIYNCATYIRGAPDERGVFHVHESNFCRVRLCPTCMWRRSLKTFGQMFKVISVLQHDYEFIKLNLTQKNVEGKDLEEELKKLSYAWGKFINYKRIKNVVKGYYRATEVTHNLDPKSNAYDTYHPHFHCLFAVNKSYFSGRTYIKAEDWKKMWAKALKINYLPNMYIDKVKKEITDYENQDMKSCIAELAKYTCKPDEIITPDNWQMSEKTLELLDKTLDKKRFIAMGGVFKDTHKRLNLDDIEDGDLVHINEDNITEKEKEEIYYEWHSGYCQYIKMK